MAIPEPGSKNKFLRPILIGIIGITLISGFTIFFTFTRGLYKPPSLPDQVLVIQGARVFTGDTMLLGTPSVVIEGETITCVGEDCDWPAEAQVIDGSGQTLMPGLIDGYVRFYSPTEENLSKGDLSGFLSFIKQRPDVRRNLIRRGITTIFSAGDLPQNILLLKDQQSKWDMAGPRIVCTGPDFTAPDGFPLNPLYKGNEALEERGVVTESDPAAAQLEAADLMSYGVDAIKVVLDDQHGSVPKLNPDVLHALAEVAESKGRYLVARCGNEEDMVMAMEAGVRILAYGPAAPLDTATLSMMAQNSVTYYPLMASRSRGDLPRLRENVAAMDEAGISVGIGSLPRGEGVRFGDSFLKEMELQQEAGRSAEELLKTATWEAARVLRIDDRIGQVSEQLEADLILVKGNPVEDLQSLRNISTVIQGGHLMVIDGELQD